MYPLFEWTGDVGFCLYLYHYDINNYGSFKTQMTYLEVPIEPLCMLQYGVDEDF